LNNLIKEFAAQNGRFSNSNNNNINININKQKCIRSKIENKGLNWNRFYQHFMSSFFLIEVIHTSFWCLKIGAKAALKKLVKLTLGGNKV
jgi:hypothetical protein